MKELSIEDKAKRYDEALEKAKNYHSTETACNVRIAMENLFPVLKESEDERIRKGLIKILNEIVIDTNYKGLGIDYNIRDMIAWLEKQRDYDRLIEEMKKRKELLSKEKEKATSTNDKLSLGGRIAMLQELLAFNICNTTDNDEPKFKVGDWVVFIASESIYQVEKIENYEYTLRHILGGSLRLSFSNEELIREWTIADAKDGDVLYSLDSKQPFIYKERPQFSQARGHCCINKFGEFAIWNTSKCVICTDKYSPATKEQRDTLMKEMANAGYTFDFEKKELKNIEQKTLDPDKVIKWLEENVPMFGEVPCSPNRIIDKFKGDFEI